MKMPEMRYLARCPREMGSWEEGHEQDGGGACLLGHILHRPQGFAPP